MTAHTQTAGTPAQPCAGCGASVAFAPGTTALQCPYCGISKACQFCGTALVADTANDTQIAPEAVLPFGLDRGGARSALRGWAKTRWFAPNRLKKVTEAETMKSTYLPHWTFDASTVSDYVGQRGEHYWVTKRHNGRTRRERRTRWYPAGGSVARAFDDVLVAATTGSPGSSWTSCSLAAGARAPVRPGLCGRAPQRL
ncbi:hypothetical protein ACQEVF_10950 [Nonomuraea polychroma]|uniref:hypothetical protein n=1 Tax=Nonomuraea polychroma TaxID=46176 RepID=UPI003D950A07